MDIGLTFPSFFRIAMEGRGRLGRPADGIAGAKPQAVGQENPSDIKAEGPRGAQPQGSALRPMPRRQENLLALILEEPYQNRHRWTRRIASGAREKPR